MNDNYSFLADFLNKFHSANSWIQLVVTLILPLGRIALVLGLACILRLIIRDISLARRRTDVPSGELLYSLYRDAVGTVRVYSHEHRLETEDLPTLALFPAPEQKSEPEELSCDSPKAPVTENPSACGNRYGWSTEPETATPYRSISARPRWR